MDLIACLWKNGNIPFTTLQSLTLSSHNYFILMFTVYFLNWSYLFLFPSYLFKSQDAGLVLSDSLATAFTLESFLLNFSFCSFSSSKWTKPKHAIAETNKQKTSMNMQQMELSQNMHIPISINKVPGKNHGLLKWMAKSCRRKHANKL